MAQERELLGVGLRNGDRITMQLDKGSGGEPDEPPGNGRPGIVELLATGGPAAGRRVWLSGGSHRLGRGATCEIQLEDPSLSREHLEITVGDGELKVRDLQSRNGTAIEGEALPSGGKVTVAVGQHVEAGRTLLAFAVPQTREDATSGSFNDGALKFNRPPRVGRRAPGASFELGAVPTKMA